MDSPSESVLHRGGLGGYVMGTISSLSHYQMLYIYVGQQGSECVKSFTFNGGGGCVVRDLSNVHAAGQGGGGTDIRLTQHTNGTWGVKVIKDEDYLYEGEGDASFDSRLLVAGGGGGGNRYAQGSSVRGSSIGGDAGGLKGYSGNASGASDPLPKITAPTGGTQTGGGTGGFWNGSIYYSYNGSWGYGNYGNFGGAGGGYYGGGSGCDGGSAVSSGAGGSSYVSGHGGCSTLTYSGKTYTFTSPEIWDGLGYKWNSSAATSTRGFPNTAGSGTENGHTGNGYAKITLITPVND